MQSDTQGQGFGNEPQVISPVQPRTSGMAIASLILGVVGFCVPCISALIGLILGIVALVSINKSNGRLKGTGLAVSGIVVSATTMLFVPVLLAILMPALAKTKDHAQRIACEANLRALGAAMQMYTNDNDGRYPTGSRWCDLLISNAGAEKRLFVCKASGSPESSYAMNKNAEAAGKDAPPDMVLVFESRPGWNQCGGPELLSTENHETGCNVLFADYHVEFVKKKDVGSLKWTVDGTQPQSEAEKPQTQPVLAFHIVPNLDSERRPALTKEEFDRCCSELSASGPGTAKVADDTYIWLPVKEAGFDRVQDLPNAKFESKTYILLGTGSLYSLVPYDDGMQVWGFRKVYRQTDATGRPAVGFRLDTKGGKLFFQLTSTNVRNRLAIVYGGQVISAPVVQSPLMEQGIITGDFTDAQADAMIKTLKEGLPPTK